MIYLKCLAVELFGKASLILTGMPSSKNIVLKTSAQQHFSEYLPPAICSDQFYALAIIITDVMIISNLPGCVLSCLDLGSQEVVAGVAEKESGDSHGPEDDGDPADLQGRVDVVAGQVLPAVKTRA